MFKSIPMIWMHMSNSFTCWNIFFTRSTCLNWKTEESTWVHNSWYTHHLFYSIVGLYLFCMNVFIKEKDIFSSWKLKSIHISNSKLQIECTLALSFFSDIQTFYACASKICKWMSHWVLLLFFFLWIELLLHFCFIL